MLETGVTYTDMTAWQEALDMAGLTASLEELRAHLDAAPDPDHPDAAFLRGYLASQEQPELLHAAA